MPPIFVSYRREDTEGEAGRLFDALVERFGKANVFFDVAAIRKGYDFRQAIDSSVSKCGVLLAIIGKHWIDQTGDNGNRRLDDPSDYVRLEIASALQRADPVPVIPVLVHGAKMPSSSQLPDDLKPLSYRNGTGLTHDRWHSDLQLLIDELTPYVQPTPSPKPKHWWQSRLTIQISLLVIPLIAVGVFFSLPRSSSVPEPGAPTSTGPRPHTPTFHSRSQTTCRAYRASIAVQLRRHLDCLRNATPAAPPPHPHNPSHLPPRTNPFPCNTALTTIAKLFHVEQFAHHPT